MTLGEMKSDVRRRLNESGTVFFSDDDIAESLQEGLDEIADICEYYEREMTLSLLRGRTYYDLTSLTPETFLSPRRGWNTTTQRWVRATDYREQDDQTYSQWESVSGQPEAYLMRGNWWLGVWPRNSSDVGGLRFYHTAIPESLADDDEPAFPREFHPAAAEFALFDLLGQQRETEKALLLWTSFLSYCTRLKQHVDKRQQIAERRVL